MKKKQIDTREQSDRTYVLIEARGILQYCKDHIRLGGKPCECPFLYKDGAHEDLYCLVGYPAKWALEGVDTR